MKQFIFLLSFAVLTTGCATRFLVPANRFVLPENTGALFKGDVKTGMASTGQVELADDVTAASPDTTPILSRNSAVHIGADLGLASFPPHDLAKRQASGFGAMIWFEVKGGLTAGKVLMDRINLWTLAENLGSVESLITHPVTMTHADVEEAERRRVGITDGLVRLSVGLEDADDLIEALRNALGN